MIITTTATIPDQTISKILEIVSGTTVETKHIGKDLIAGFKSITGGEIKGYSSMLEQAREKATNRLKEQARLINADAIVNVKYITSSIDQGIIEVLVYGTAVTLKK